MPALSHGRRRLGVALVWLFFVPLAAQQFAADNGGFHPLVTIDFDGDGDVDLLGVRADTPGLLLMQNDGFARFGPPVVLAPENLAIAVADFDGNGRPDVAGFIQASGNPSNYELQVRMQSPWGVLSTVVLSPQLAVPPSTIFESWLAAIDLDLDGDADLVGAVSTPPTWVAYRNDGGGQFTDVTGAWTSGLALPTAGFAVKVLDIDGDGRSDLFVQADRARLFVNLGTSFLDISAASLPNVAVGRSSVADVDGDGDPDLLVVDGTFGLRLWRNHLGAFTDVSATTLPPGQLAVDAHFYDADGDGDADMIVQTGGLPRLAILVNDGAGQFTQSVPLPDIAPVPNATTLVAPFDADGDGDDDLAVPGTLALRILFNDGARGLRLRPGQQVDTRFGTTAIPVDVDGDGDADLLSSTGISFSEPGGRRSWLPHTLTGPLAPVRIGDVDGDGDLDVLGDVLYLNDGSGVFTPSPASFLPLGVGRALGDFDGDGDLDALIENSGWSIRDNNGLGQFTFTGTSLPAAPAWFAVALGDADADGLLDILLYPPTPQPSASPVLIRNQGGGFFITQPVPMFAGRARFVDLQGGPEPYLIVDLIHNEPPRFYRRTANGYNDIAAYLLPVPLASGSLGIGDIDLDGDTDLVWNSDMPYLTTSHFLRNNGVSQFSLAPLGTTLLPGEFPRLADLDGDGDLDIAAQSRILWNAERQLTLPLHAQTGRALRVELTARPGRAAPTDLALLGIGFARPAVPIATPFGTAHMTPIAALPVFYSGPAGEAAVSLTIPNMPGLVGLPVELQALFVGPTGAVLGNLANTTIE